MSIQTAPTPLPVPAISAIGLDSRYLLIKRIIDVVFTLLILIPLGIIMAITAVCIRLDSKGSIFYRQKRIGQNGRLFEILKFRSMYENSDDLLHRQAITRYMNGETINGEAPADLSYKKVNDPRVTRVGRFIRKTSIDELPQFLNVLRGDMTLVGPRPPLFYEVELYSAHDWLRLSGKPGLTGPWQVYGRSKVPFSAMVEMDIAYLQRQSMWEDLKLIALTIPVMVLGRGGAW